MMQRYSTMRAAALAAVVGALALAGCGGGGGQSTLPSTASANTPTGTSAKNGTTLGTLSIVGLPKTTSTASTTHVAALPASTTRTPSSTARNPQYIDTTTQNSALVVSVTPQDPAEAAQYGSLTVCYNLYTGGVLNPALQTTQNPLTVTVSFPAPPGTDGFQVTQYAGQCGSTPYTLPVVPAGSLNGGVLSQTPIAYALLLPGVTNNINAGIANCTITPAPGPTPIPAGSGSACAQANPVGTGLLVASVAVAKVQFDPLVPITSPVREQGAFLLPGTNTIGVPIPLEGLNAGGTVIPGLTTPANPNGGAGPFPSGVTVTLAENLGGTTGNPAHAKLYLIDAATGAIAQAGQGANQAITITEFNALDAADNVHPGGGTVGDPYVLVMTYDGSGYLGTSGTVFAGVASETVTATATTANAALPSPISLTISPQSAVWSAGGTGYADAAAPVKPVGLIEPTTPGPIYMTDGATVKIDGTATVSAPATGTALTGLTYATWPAGNFIYAVDSAQAGGATAVESASGLYAYNATTLASVPVSAQAGANNYIQFPNPVAVVQAQGPAGSTHPYLFVVSSGGGIYRVDISGASETSPVNGFQEATNVLPILSLSGTQLNPGTSKYLGTALLPGGTGQFLIADPGNNRIAEVDDTLAIPAITTWASGQAFTGFTLTTNGTGGTAMYATTLSGEIYYIASAGATPVSLGFATSTTQTDGPVGQFTNQTPATTPTLTPVNYPLQGQAANFFATTATTTTTPFSTPYTVSPFAGPGVFTVPPAGIGLAPDTSSGATTGKGTINATAGIVIYPSQSAATATVTPGSLLFTDSGTKLRTLVQ